MGSLADLQRTVQAAKDDIQAQGTAAEQLFDLFVAALNDHFAHQSAVIRLPMDEEQQQAMVLPYPGGTLFLGKDRAWHTHFGVPVGGDSWCELPISYAPSRSVIQVEIGFGPEAKAEFAIKADDRGSFFVACKYVESRIVRAVEDPFRELDERKSWLGFDLLK